MATVQQVIQVTGQDEGFIEVNRAQKRFVNQEYLIQYIRAAQPELDWGDSLWKIARKPWRTLIPLAGCGSLVAVKRDTYRCHVSSW